MIIPVPPTVDRVKSTRFASSPPTGYVVRVIHTSTLKSLSETSVTVCIANRATEEHNKNQRMDMNQDSQEMCTPSLSTRITRVELMPRLRLSPIVSRVRSTVKFVTHSTKASARTVTLTHTLSPSEEPNKKDKDIVIAMKSPSVSDAGK